VDYCAIIFKYWKLINNKGEIMKPAEYLPLYGFIKTPQKSKIYIGTRKLYLDVNPEVYNFMINIVKQINNEEKINVDEKWKEELKNYQEFFVGKKPIFKVFLKKVGVNKQKKSSIR
jgi:hypothetical protein